MLQEAHGDSSDAGHVTQVREPCELMSEVTSLTKLSHSSHSVAVSGLVMGGPPVCHSFIIQAPCVLILSQTDSG